MIIETIGCLVFAAITRYFTKVAAISLGRREQSDGFRLYRGTTPPEVRRLLVAAHAFLQEALPPFATRAIKWKIPFYRLHCNLCYLNRHTDHITLGFPYGWKLVPRPNILLGKSENLKQVRYLEIRIVEDLYSDRMLQILHEAIIVDESMSVT